MVSPFVILKEKKEKGSGFTRTAKTARIITPQNKTLTLKLVRVSNTRVVVSINVDQNMHYWALLYRSRRRAMVPQPSLKHRIRDL